MLALCASFYRLCRNYGAAIDWPTLQTKQKEWNYFRMEAKKKYMKIYHFILSKLWFNYVVIVTNLLLSQDYYINMLISLLCWRIQFSCKLAIVVVRAAIDLIARQSLHLTCAPITPGKNMCHNIFVCTHVLEISKTNKTSWNSFSFSRKCLVSEECVWVLFWA